MPLLPQRPVLLIVEGMCKDYASVLAVWRPLLGAVVPALVTIADCGHEEGVVRFVCLEALYNITTHLLSAIPSQTGAC